MSKRWYCKLCLRPVRQSEFEDHLDSHHNVVMDVLVSDFGFIQALFMLYHNPEED